MTSRVEPEARFRLLTEIDPEVVTVIPATLTTASSFGTGYAGHAVLVEPVGGRAPIAAGVAHPVECCQQTTSLEGLKQGLRRCRRGFRRASDDGSGNFRDTVGLREIVPRHA